jgi:hypothetical protein
MASIDFRDYGRYQCCGYGSGFALIWFSWIRIRIENEDPEPDPDAKKLTRKFTNNPGFQPFKLAFVPT